MTFSLALNDQRNIDATHELSQQQYYRKPLSDNNRYPGMTFSGLTFGRPIDKLSSETCHDCIRFTFSFNRTREMSIQARIFWSGKETRLPASLPGCLDLGFRHK